MSNNTNLEEPVSVPCKLVTIGDGAVGKTCLLMVFAKKEFMEDYVPTIFDNFDVSLTVDGKNIELSAWDTAGQEEYDRLRPCSYPGTNIFLVCFSLVDQSSYNNVEAKWMPEIKHHCPNALVVLVGTKLDLREDPQKVKDLQKVGKYPVTKEQGEEMKKKINATLYIECSAKKNASITDVLESSIRAHLVRSNPKKKAICSIL